MAVYQHGCNSVIFKNSLFCKLLSVSLTVGPKPTLLIRKLDFRTSNEGTLSCLIESLLFYSIKSIIRVVWDRDWLSECDYLHLIQHSFFSSISYSQYILNIHWGNYIFVILSFHLLMDIFNDSAAQCICWLLLTRCLLKIKITPLFTTLFQSISI